MSNPATQYRAAWNDAALDKRAFHSWEEEAAVAAARGLQLIPPGEMLRVGDTILTWHFRKQIFEAWQVTPGRELNSYKYPVYRRHNNNNNNNDPS